MRDIPIQVTMLETNAEYEKFTEKFKPKKTTDDCYTPPNIYEVVLDWVVEEYGINRDDVCRPFYPGGDYERYEYDDSSVVVDNPPFSILSEIINFYVENKIDFFLFAPSLTNFSSGKKCSHIITGASITYENGAEVITSFVTNLDSRLVYGCPELYRRIKSANDKNLKENKKQLPKYEYPFEVLTAAMVQRYVKYGVTYELDQNDATHIRKLDSQGNKAIFGSGFLLSERAAAERAAAERAAAERAAAERAAAEKWKLSEREKQIVKMLSRKQDEKKEEQRMRAFIKRPNEPFLETVINNELRAFQQAVGGYIETVGMTDGKDTWVVVADEEGRLKGYDHNCAIHGVDFVGTIVVVGVDGDEFADVPGTLEAFTEWAEVIE